MKLLTEPVPGIMAQVPGGIVCNTVTVAVDTAGVPVPVQVAVTVLAMSAPEVFARKVIEKFCALAQAAPVQNVAVLVPPVKMPPLAPLMVPVHCPVALTAWKLRAAVPPALPIDCVDGASGDAGPKLTLPPVLPQPVPTPAPVATACNCPGVAFDDTWPVG
ncbi:MAG: hypothetical protein P4L92_19625 [Rudaea sp.]|nr:hypothetical protein [Rudaea sp.]